jgi:hypothetical protein
MSENKKQLLTVKGRMKRLVSLNFVFAVNVFMCGFLTNSVLLRLMEDDHSYIGVRIAMLALCGASTLLHIIGGRGDLQKN